MKTMPVMLNIQGRTAVVVGSGAVGARKARQLLAAGAKVTVVADRKPAPDLLAGMEGAEVLVEPYEARHLAAAAVVFACTDNRDLNARIAADARAAGAWVNAADQPADCDFLLPACWGDGDVVLAVGTGGAAPALAAWLRDLAAAAMPPRLGEFAHALAEVRSRVQADVGDPSRRMAIMKRLAGAEGYAAFAAGGLPALHRLADER